MYRMAYIVPINFKSGSQPVVRGPTMVRDAMLGGPRARLEIFRFCSFESLECKFCVQLTKKKKGTKKKKVIGKFGWIN